MILEKITVRCKRGFRTYRGGKVTADVEKVRIMKAKKLLENTSADIGTIAESVGYSDLQYFYRVFKKNTQKTPMSYRNITKKVQ